MRQLILELPHRPALGREDFLVSDSNAAAAALIDAWPDWPSPAAIIVGPAGSGKTHLAEVWRLKTGAAFARLIEDMPGAIDEAALFHLLNLARAEGGSVLMTSRTAPDLWDVKLPDLASRLKAASVVSIGAPDDALLRAVLVKHFADRQLAIDETVIGFLLTRMPRSFAAAGAIVAEIDRTALENRVEITKPLVAAVLRKLSEPELFDGPG